MYPPSRKDFIALTLPDSSNHPYNNGKHRRQSCWRKWKQLSRLQRSLILFLLMLLLIFGLFSFPSITEQWRGFSDREGWLEVNDRGVRTIIPGGKSLSDQAAEKDPPPMVRPDVGSDTVEETRDQNIPMMPKPPIKKKGASKRGPPNLQKNVGAALPDAAEGEKKELIENEGGEEDKEEKIISWRGAMIEADQATEPPPSAVDKGPVAPVPVNPAPPEGQSCTLAFLKISLVLSRTFELVNNQIPLI
eukprot:XP_011602750.1 PREDICTED: endoplasmic reticulum mannosyl-oligosaccharide 1,2-alpha-mannosidase [Takifugu rubripes]